MRLGLYEKALGVLSRTYPQVPADQSEPANVLPQDDPVVLYYRAYCEQKLGRSTTDDYAAAAKASTKYIFPSGATSYQVLKSALAANPDDANANYLLGTLEFSVDMTDAGLENWKHAQQLHPQIPALDRDIGLALLQIKGDTEGALAAFKRGVEVDDPNNLDNYFGLDQTLSLLKHPAAERVAALGHYPDLANMPTDLFYEYDLAWRRQAISIARSRSSITASSCVPKVERTCGRCGWKCGCCMPWRWPKRGIAIRRSR
jgi:tetratricopeptide (TPR) repeat protein